MTPGNTAADALLERHGRSSAPPTQSAVRSATPSPCARCKAVSRPRDRVSEGVYAPYWAPNTLWCRACFKAVATLLESTGTWPPPTEVGGWQFPASPEHTGPPHFLWAPATRRLGDRADDSREEPS